MLKVPLMGNEGEKPEVGLEREVGEGHPGFGFKSNLLLAANK